MGGGAHALLPTYPLAHSWQLVARLRRRIRHDTHPLVGLVRDPRTHTGGRVGAAWWVRRPTTLPAPAPRPVPPAHSKMRSPPLCSPSASECPRKVRRRRPERDETARLIPRESIAGRRHISVRALLPLVPLDLMFPPDSRRTGRTAGRSQYRTLVPGTSVCSSHRQVKARAWVVGEACIPDYATKKHRGEPHTGHTRGALLGAHGHHTDHTEEPHNHPPTHPHARPHNDRNRGRLNSRSPGEPEPTARLPRPTVHYTGSKTPGEPGHARDTHEP